MNKCEICGSSVRLCGKKPNRFCGMDCQRKWRRSKFKGNKLRSGKVPANSFKSGHNPWNKGKKGIHLSPSTEFVSGQVGVTTMSVGSITIRTDCNGKERAWMKIANPNKWRLRAPVVWEIANGPVPKGMVIHHDNENTLDDSLENLKCLTRRQHIELHRDVLYCRQSQCELTQKRVEEARNVQAH